MDQLRELYKYDFHIRNLAHALRYVNERKLAEFGLTSPQARLLGAIDDGRRVLETGVNRKYLEETTLLKGPSITSLLNGLEKSGFIRRSPNAHDARNTDIEITAKGNGLLGELRRFFIETESLMLQGMTEVEKEIFLHLLEKAGTNLSKKRG